MQTIAVTPERHSIEGADRPHGIEVAEHHHGLTLAGDAGANVIAALDLREQFHVRTERAQHAGQLGTAAIDRSLVRAGGFDSHEPVDRLDYVGDVLFAIRQKRGHWCL